MASRRQAGHWATLSLPDSPNAPRRALHAVYDALVAAADFFALRNLHKSGFDYPDAGSMYRAYESELYRFDTADGLGADEAPEFGAHHDVARPFEDERQRQPRRVELSKGSRRARDPARNRDGHPKRQRSDRKTDRPPRQRGARAAVAECVVQHPNPIGCRTIALSHRFQTTPFAVTW